jgi:hypothetical protein
VVAVALGGGATADDVALGIDGARRPVGPDGREKPPVVVADGSRTVLVYEVVPARTGRVAVTVVTAASRRLAGAAAEVPAPGGTTTPGQFAAAVAARGLASLVPPATADGLAHSSVYWKEPAP